VRNGNGYKGWAEEAPFDRIMVTAAPEEIPNMLVDQLTEGGVMVIPVGEQFEIQYLWVLTKEHSGSIKKEKILPVRFVPMVTKK
jgi:protein-L-isoaspartate(D-aspartate) O-methyltransferase